MELILGTAQFGMAYGIAGATSAVSPAEAARILARAWERGVRILDTATAYGDIEARLQALCGDRPFAILSKFPRLPAAASPAECADLALGHAAESRHRLGDRLAALMAHDPADLDGPRGDAVLDALRAWAAGAGIQLGLSCYDAVDGVRNARVRGLGLVQAPGNALDQRVTGVERDGAIELHLRSVFLQGLLVMPEAMANSRVPAATVALRRFHAWRDARGLSPAEAAFAVARGFGAARALVVGVDSESQWTQLADAFDASAATPARDLAILDMDIIDPRSWARTIPRPAPETSIARETRA